MAHKQLRPKGVPDRRERGGYWPVADRPEWGSSEIDKGPQGHSSNPDSDTIHSVIGVRRASQTSGVRWGAFAFLVGVALSLTACSSGPASYSGPLPQIQVQSPVETTIGWFKAVDDRNAPLALAHFAAAVRDQMKWSSWGPPFTHLHCSPQSESAKEAEVDCTYAEINDPSTGMSNQDFWDVYLQREPSGRWLINNYGQG